MNAAPRCQPIPPKWMLRIIYYQMHNIDQHGRIIQLADQKQNITVLERGEGPRNFLPIQQPIITSQKTKGYLLLESSQPWTASVKLFKNFSLCFVFSQVMKCLRSKLLTQCAHLIFPGNIVCCLNFLFLLLVFHYFNWTKKQSIIISNIFQN